MFYLSVWHVRLFWVHFLQTSLSEKTEDDMFLMIITVVTPMRRRLSGARKDTARGEELYQCWKWRKDGWLRDSRDADLLQGAAGLFSMLRCLCSWRQWCRVRSYNFPSKNLFAISEIPSDLSWLFGQLSRLAQHWPDATSTRRNHLSSGSSSSAAAESFSASGLWESASYKRSERTSPQ